MPTTSAGDPTRIASVKRLRTNVSSVRRVRTPHCVSPLATGRLITSRDAASGAGTRGGRAALRDGGAVQVGQAAVELRDRADPELLERLVDGSDEAHSPAARHEHDAIARGEVLDRVRGEHDRRRPVGELAQAGDQLRARDGVEAGRRLVEEEDVRIGEQLDGDAGALALPAAQRADPDVGVLGQAHGVDRVTDRVVDLGRGRRRREPQPRRVAERASERQVGVDDVVLRHVAEHAAERPQVGVQVDAVEAHRPRGCRGDAGDRLQQRCLAGAAGTDDRDELTSRQRERHARRGASARLGCGPGPAGTARRRRCGRPRSARRRPVGFGRSVERCDSARSAANDHRSSSAQAPVASA